jgi:hypothetical protein
MKYLVTIANQRPKLRIGHLQLIKDADKNVFLMLSTSSILT